MLTDSTVGSEPQELAVLIYSGERRTIYAYRAADGRAPALAFLESLDVIARARFIAHFKIMCDTGQLHGKYWHPWDSKKNKASKGLSCFKDNQSQSRIPCFANGQPGVLILTHGFGGKKENELDES